MDIAGGKLWSRRGFLAASLLLPPSIQILGQQPAPTSTKRFSSYDEVAALLDSGLPLPADLTGTPAERRRRWAAWIEDHDRQIRARLIRGEEDTLVNFVLFGVSFTERPRIGAEVRVFNADDSLFTARIQDFVAAVSNPGSNARLVLLKALLKTMGHDTTTSEQRERTVGYIEQSIQRYFAEREKYDETVRRALSNDTDSSYQATAHLYRNRGLSLDTDFRPNYAVERALEEAQRRGIISSVRRVAIVGPGLDFTDKDAGFDYYPLQSMQPFALVDSLLRLGLSNLRNLQVVLFDISVPVLQHLASAVERAGAGEAYTLQFLLDRTGDWNRDVIDYWGQMGEGIGSAIPPMPGPVQLARLERRAIRVVPEVVRSLQPLSLNVVTQALDLAADQRFDLIVATNVFIYYDALDQALALRNLQTMLAPTGVVLTNDVFQNYPGLRLETVGSLQVNFTPSQADQMRIYSTPAFRPQLPPQ
jgi:hypothetical protein